MRELKTFVDGLPQMMAMKQSLATHTSIAEQVKEETERRQFLEFLQAEQELLNFQGLARSVAWNGSPTININKVLLQRITTS